LRYRLSQGIGLFSLLIKPVIVASPPVSYLFISNLSIGLHLEETPLLPLYATMDWLRMLFSGTGSAKAAERKAKKRASKRHSKRVREREKELRCAKQHNGSKKPAFFWGSPGQTYENNVRGPDEQIRVIRPY
jgi:hypothetical protein